MAPDAQSNHSADSRRADRALAAVASASVVVAATLLRFPPDRFAFYPRCPFYALTGLECPGCGATRALAALLQGHLAEALHWNALVVLLLPLLGLYLAAGFLRTREGHAWPHPRPAAIFALLMIAVVFGIIRDLPTHTLSF